MEDIEKTTNQNNQIFPDVIVNGMFDDFLGACVFRTLIIAELDILHLRVSLAAHLALERGWCLMERVLVCNLWEQVGGRFSVYSDVS